MAHQFIGATIVILAPSILVILFLCRLADAGRSTQRLASQLVRHRSLAVEHGGGPKALMANRRPTVPVRQANRLRREV
jgi:hypothetical protein